MHSGFLIGWLLMAVTVLVAWVYGVEESWAPASPVAVASVALVLGAAVRLASVRIAGWLNATEMLHAFQIAGAGLLLVTLALLWTGFWLVDLHLARFSLVLLAVPAGVVGLAMALSVDARLGSSVARIVWWSLVIAFVAIAPGTVPDHHAHAWFAQSLPWSIRHGVFRGTSLGLSGIGLSVFVVSRWMPAIAPPSRLDGISRALFVTASGCLVGLAAVWPLFVERSLSHSASSAFRVTVVPRLPSMASRRSPWLRFSTIRHHGHRTRDPPPVTW